MHAALLLRLHVQVESNGTPAHRPLSLDLRIAPSTSFLTATLQPRHSPGEAARLHIEKVLSTLSLGRYICDVADDGAGESAPRHELT